MGVSAAGAETLLVANQKDQNLSVIDTSSNKVVATIPVGGVTGHELAVSPDGKRAFVPIYGDAGVGRAGTNGSVISVIDLASKKIVGTGRLRSWRAAALCGLRQGRHAAM